MRGYELGLALIGLSSAASIGDGHASPWGRGAGESFEVARTEFYRAEDQGRRFEQTTLESYVEWGITDRWGVGGKLTHGFQSIETAKIADNRDGIVEANIFVQRHFTLGDGAAAAIQLLYDFDTTTRSIFDRSVADRRDAGVQLSGLWGASDKHSFTTYRLGYRASLGDDSDLIKLDMTWGHHTAPRQMLLFDLYTTFSANTAEADGQDYDLVTFAPSYVFPLTKRSRLQLGGRVDLWGDGLDTGNGGFLSFWWGR